MKNIKYLLILLVVALVSIPLVYYGITKGNFLNIFKEETVAPLVKSPAPPKVTVEIQRSKTEDVLIVRWDNIPRNTARIKIYRARAGTTDWVLWKTIDITNITAGGGIAGGGAGSFIGNAENGSFSISLSEPSGGNENYVYYVQAIVPTDTSTGTGGGPPPEEILWTSPVTAPLVVTSTPPSTTESTPPPAPPTPQPTSTAPSTTTPSQPTSSPPVSPPTTPSGIPYYTPQGTISGYGQPQSGNFWVQHTDNKIDIGWQNLPAGTASFVVSRSQDQNGPWVSMLTQKNPPITGGPYSIKILDHTLYEPYYYKMDVYDQNNGIMASYGPAYLPPLGQ